MKIILASKSPSRKKLFEMIVKEFEVVVSNFDESSINVKSPKKLVETLSKCKCEKVFEMTMGERCVVGADTVICVGNKIYGKPKDDNDAKNMLKSYSGNIVKAITGVCIKYVKDEMETEISFSTTTKIKCREIYESEIDDLIKAKEHIGVAGAMIIEKSFIKFVDKINGSYDNIIGLHISKIYEIFKSENIF